MSIMALAAWAEEAVEARFVPGLTSYVKAISDARDENARRRAALEQVQAWIAAQSLEDARVELSNDDDSPALLLVIDTPDAIGNVLFYSELVSPDIAYQSKNRAFYTPRRVEQRFFAQNAVVGSAIFAAVLVAKALQRAGRLRHRLAFVFGRTDSCYGTQRTEDCEFWREAIRKPTLVCCFAAQVPDARRLYCVTSARGALTFELTADTLISDAHSGMMGGMVPDGVQACLAALDAFEERGSGAIEALSADMPADRFTELVERVEQNDWMYDCGVGGAVTPALLVAQRHTWNAALSVVGQRGLPSLCNASNVLRRYWTLILQLALPPTLSIECALEVVERHFKRGIKGSYLSVTERSYSLGFNQPALPVSFKELINKASIENFGLPALAVGSPAPVPAAAALIALFGPEPLYLVTGATTLSCDMGGCQESVDLTHIRKLVCSVAALLDELGPSFNT